ncbi:hypothetical protein QA601_13650 [Chitinispirillales bacterium ANBcel5]|uniref:hypothetical protein n=1 Tax=Cellulosispirillum alkaliphilum TaxID=3039283 RepID=UPI002A54ABA5|nr:hypothetical protein [Chitinispirillales bacterium ANBcel5]
MYSISDKRKFERKPCCDKAVFYRKTGDNRSDERAVYLRDVSEGGISGTYFGNDIPKKDETLIIHTDFQGPKAAKLAWSFRSIDSIYMLGFKYIDDSDH